MRRLSRPFYISHILAVSLIFSLILPNAIHLFSHTKKRTSYKIKLVSKTELIKKSSTSSNISDFTYYKSEKNNHTHKHFFTCLICRNSHNFNNLIFSNSVSEFSNFLTLMGKTLPKEYILFKNIFLLLSLPRAPPLV